jgi:hypothetical protein
LHAGAWLLVRASSRQCRWRARRLWEPARLPAARRTCTSMSSCRTNLTTTWSRNVHSSGAAPPDRALVPLLGGRNARNGGRGERDAEPTAADGYSSGRADRWAPRHRRRTRRGSQPDSHGGQDDADRRDRRYDRRAALAVLATRGHGHAPRAAAAGHRKAAPIPQRTGLICPTRRTGFSRHRNRARQEAKGTLRFRQSVGRGDPANRPNTLI